MMYESLAVLVITTSHSSMTEVRLHQGCGVAFVFCASDWAFFRFRFTIWSLAPVVHKLRAAASAIVPAPTRATVRACRLSKSWFASCAATLDTDTEP